VGHQSIRGRWVVRDDEEQVPRGRLRDLAWARPCYGYRRMTALDELLTCVAPESGSGQEFSVGYSRLRQRP
jgi:hypothetical protein